MVLIILFSIVCVCSGMPAEHFSAVVEFHGILPGLVDIVECETIQGHGIDTGLIGLLARVAPLHCSPDGGSSVRPLRADVRLVLRRDSQGGHLAPT